MGLSWQSDASDGKQVDRVCLVDHGFTGSGSGLMIRFEHAKPTRIRGLSYGATSWRELTQLRAVERSSMIRDKQADDAATELPTIVAKSDDPHQTRRFGVLTTGTLYGAGAGLICADIASKASGVNDRIFGRSVFLAFGCLALGVILGLGLDLNFKRQAIFHPRCTGCVLAFLAAVYLLLMRPALQILR